MPGIEWWTLFLYGYSSALVASVASYLRLQEYLLKLLGVLKYERNTDFKRFLNWFKSKNEFLGFVSRNLFNQIY